MASNKANILSYSLGGQKSEMGLNGLKSRNVNRAAFLSVGSEGESVSLPWLDSKGHRHCLVDNPLPSSKPLMVYQIFLMLHQSDTESPVSLCDLCDYVHGAHQIIQNTDAKAKLLSPDFLATRLLCPWDSLGKSIGVGPGDLPYQGD